MDHPGVKTLLDRIAHQNAFKKSDPQEAGTRKEIFGKPDPIRTNNSATDSSQFCRLADFKESLKQRMKAKRLQIRKEEEEEEKMDEEYHKRDDETDKEKKSKEADGTEEPDDMDAVLGEEEDEEEDEGDEGDDEDGEDEESTKIKKKNNIEESENESDSDFKLNLNSEDEGNSDNDDSNSSSDKKKVKNSSSGNKKQNVYEFDSGEDDAEKEDLDNDGAKKRSKHLKKYKKQASEIPLTNSIPSNQLTKGSAANKFADMMSQDVLFNEESQPFDKARRSLDELTNISFNYDANTSVHSNHNANNQSGNNINNLDESEANSVHSDELDELAMLCSGQFRGNTQKKSSTTTGSLPDKKDTNKQLPTEDDNEVIEKSSEGKNKTKENPIKNVAFENNDLFAADEEDDLEKDEELKSKFSKVTSFSESSNSNTDSNTNSSKDEKKIKESEKSAKALSKTVDRNDDDNDDEVLTKEDFFENEAELSGSERESDENYEGESGDDSIVFSGDEAELADNDELKEELGQIYLKDQLDRDNRELRLFKEMYLKDGENESKGLRKKKFLWKNFNDDRYDGDDSTSEDEDDDEDEEDENEDAEEDPEKKQAKLDEKLKRKNEFFAKRNWRSQRHEREEFHKSKKGDLIEDGFSDGENSNRIFLNSCSSNSTENTCDIVADGDGTMKQNRLLKMGQMLLKEGQFKAKKRSSECLTSCDNLVDLTRKSDMTETIKTTSNVKKTADDENVFKKFSFLNRDKSYLNRLSSYVNKNISSSVDGNNVQTKSIIRASNMCFTSLGADESDAKNNANARNGLKNVNSSNAKNPSNDGKNLLIQNEDSPVIVESKSKRLKHDTSESIFNHMN